MRCGSAPIARMRYKAQYTSPRRASNEAATTDSDQCAFIATTSRLHTGIIGNSSAHAIDCAAAMPTRIPVKSPGPTSTATAERSDISTSACCITN